MAQSQQVHTYISDEAFDFYASQFDGADLNKTTFRQGAFDEDEPYANPWNESRPYFRHLWDHDSNFNRVFDDGWSVFDSAANRAVKYFTGGYGADGRYDTDWGNNGTQGHGITWMYQNGNETQAFDWLGHAAHLLQDLTVPAHSHADGHGREIVGIDSYEEFYIGVDNNWTQWGHPATQDRGGPTGDIGRPTNLFNYMTTVVNTTDNFDSDQVDGQVDQGSRNHYSLTEGWHIDDDDSRTIGDTLMPLSMKATAELIRYFYHQVDSSDPVITFTQFSSDPNNPTPVNTSTVSVSGSASDPQSGIGISQYDYLTGYWNGSMWVDVKFHGPGEATQNLGPFEDGLYYTYLRAENGGGAKGTSGFSYFLVDTSEPDVIAPGNVTNFTATPGNGQVSLSWSNPSDSDFAGVKIQRKTGGYPTSHTDGTTVYNSTGEIYTDTGLTNGTTYYYKAFTYDEVPNYSSGSSDSAIPHIPTKPVVLLPSGRNLAEPDVNGYFRVFRSGSTTSESLRVYYSVSGSATEGTVRWTPMFGQPKGLFKV